MEKVIFADPEEVRQLLVVSRHDLGLGGRDLHAGDLAAGAADLEDVVNVLDGAEALGVETEGRRCVQLDEASLELEFDGLGSPSLPSSNLCVRKRVHGSKSEPN